jgi:hypothetical protein
MVAFAARGVDAFESVIGLQDVGSGLLLTLAVALLVPIGWGYLAVVPRPDARRTPAVPSQIGTRLRWRRTIARQQAWTSGRTTFRSIRPLRPDPVLPGRPSPPIRRLRARAALRHLTDGWRVVRCPH